MAPARQPPRRIQSSQNEHVFDLGVTGRKTGLTVEHKGQLDEHGMEPIDGFFSSPAKHSTKKTPRRPQNISDDDQEMDIDEDDQPGPATLMKELKDRQSRNRLSLPRARSPIKTYLASPAKHNPHLGAVSSPAHGSVVRDRRENGTTKPPVTRRLDFSNDSNSKSASNGHSKAKSSRLQNGKSPYTLPESEESEDDDDAVLVPTAQQKKAAYEIEDEEEGEEEEEEEEDPMPDFDYGGNEDLPSPVQEGSEVESEQEEVEEDDEEDPEVEEEEEEEEEEETPVEIVEQPKKRGRKPKAKQVDDSLIEDAPAEPEEAEQAPVRKAGRPKGVTKKVPEPAVKSPKRPRSDRNSPDDENDAAPEERETKRQRTEKQAKASKGSSTAPTAKGKPGRPRNSSGVGVASPEVQRGPPMPRQRGLQIRRQEDPSSLSTTTRSGRSSFRPLEFWKGERVEYDENDEDLLPDKNGRYIKVGSKVRSIVRIEDAEGVAKPRRKAGRPAGRPGKPRISDVEEEDEREEWEEDPGRIAGECIFWYPEHEHNPPTGDDQVEVIEEELAVSEQAIQMKDIKDATFQFAKTLTLPFFGSGLVDLPPHSEKRPKNSRKMQMVFFVHYGHVQVTVAQTTFAIGKGGQWFVPRGNQYSIENNTDRPARIFFSQGCEVAALGPSQEL